MCTHNENDKSEVYPFNYTVRIVFMKQDLQASLRQSCIAELHLRIY